MLPSDISIGYRSWQRVRFSQQCLLMIMSPFFFENIQVKKLTRITLHLIQFSVFTTTFFFILTLKTFLEVLVYDEIKIKLWMEWKGPWISAVMEREWFHELHFELYQTVVFLWMVHVKCKGWIFSLCIIIIQIRLTGITIITLTWNVTGKFCSYNCTQDVMKNNNKTLLWILRFSNLCNFNTCFLLKSTVWQQFLHWKQLKNFLVVL